MRKFLSITFAIIISTCLHSALHAQDRIFCDIAEIDEINGAPLQTVAGVAADNDGYLWFATWNGLNRFDGTRLLKIPMKMRHGDMPLSERYYSITLSGKGNLWCMIDNHLTHFDTGTYTFSDISSALEKKFGPTLDIEHIFTADNGFLVVKTSDSKWITIGSDEDPSNATLYDTRPSLRRMKVFNSLGKATLQNAGVTDCAYGGTINGLDIIVARDGEIKASLHGKDEFRQAGYIDTGGRRIVFHDIDSNHNLWLGTSGRIFRVSIGIKPYTELPVHSPDKVRATMSDSGRRLWVAESDGNAIGLYTPDGKRIGYLAADGHLSDTYIPYGHKVYSLAEYPGGTVWVGTKPDGLFRYSISADGKATLTGHCSEPQSIYDIVPDPHGRLWLASFDKGLSCIERPLTDNVTTILMSDFPGYPEKAMRTRRLSINRDSLFAASTQGLLVAPLPERLSSFRPSMISSGDSPGSLSGIALSDVALTPGRVITAGESSGINVGSGSPPHFIPYKSAEGPTADIIQSLTLTPDLKDVIVASLNVIYIMSVEDNGIKLLKRSLGNVKMRYTEPRPLFATDSTLLLAHTRGALLFNLNHHFSPRRMRPIFTSASIQNRPDSLLSAGTDTIILGKDQRNITLRFSAMEYNSPDEIAYSFDVDDNGWTPIGNTTSLTLLDLEPGTHTVGLRATAPDGTQSYEETSMTIIVSPRFHETLMAKMLLALLIATAIAAIVWIGIYIRRMKRNRQELLEAYLHLISENTTGNPDTTHSKEKEPSKPSLSGISTADKQFMDRIAEFVESNLANPDITVDDMTAAIGTSRSSLTRKMRSLVGFTPAEFIKQSRLKKAAAMLLADNDAPITNIALDCGFSDLNYFSKCFKTTYGSTPSLYRQKNQETQ